MRRFLICSILAVWCTVVAWSSAAAARPVHQYTCQPVEQPSGGCGPGCQKAIGTALLQLHAGLKGGEHSMPWHGEGPLGNTLCQEHCHAVPQYCGWAGVLCCHPEHDLHPHRNGTSCRGTDVEHEVCPDNTTPGAVWKLDLTMQKLGGSLTNQVIDALKVLTSFGLHAIDFSSNNLSGTIPERLSELGPNFTTINLNFNKLTGTIPPSIKKLPNLKHVFLSFNKLNGSLDGHFCTKQNDPLEVLILRANFLSGTADLSACTELLLLDLTDNRFTGVVPVGITNTKLVSLRATNNLFSGSIPNDIWKLPLLTTVDLGNNELSGRLSEFVGTSNNLVNIYLGNNSLTGTLPESIVSNSQLLVLELQNNTQLYGTFPSVGALVGLRRLDIHNTSISGSIPEEWGELPYLEYIDISGTRMSCCEHQSQADDGPTLPPFLQFSKRFMQFDLNMPTWGARVLDDLEDVSSQPNNILCRTVVRKPAPESEWNKLQLPTINNVVDSQRWQVSPLYFWFDECTCTKFQDKSGTTYRYTGVDLWCDADYNKALNVTPGPCLDMPMFVCEPLSSLLKPGVRAAIAVAAFMFTLIIAGIVAYFLLSKASKVRRFVQLTQVRLKGPPRSGPMTLVVTDIEGYSDIFRRAPEVMFKALVLHNSVLRGAKYHNGGFVLEQEGDSFTIAFYDPFSAVVFCLQAQQALLAVQWPAGLEAVQNPDTSNHTEPGGSRRGSKFNLRLSPLLGFGPKLKRVNTNNSTRSVGSNVDYQPSVTHSMFYSNLLQGFGSKENLAEPVLFNGLRVRMGVVTGVVPEGTAIKNSALFQLAKVVGDFGNGGQIILDEATFGAIKEDAQALGAVEASGLNHSKLSSGRSGWNRLLRCCGCIRPNAPAEEVVLLDMGAFCQSRGEEADAALPYTTSRTLDVKQPDTQQPGTPSSWWHTLWQPCRPCSPCCKDAEDGVSGDGSETSPRTSLPLPPAAQLSRPYLGSRPRSGASSSISFGASLSGPASSGRCPGATAGSVSPTEGQQQQSGELFDLPEASDVAPKQDTAVTNRMASFSLIGAASKQITELRKTFTRSQSWQAGQADARRDWESVRLYQVLPPALAARAHTWHNKLNVKDGWICWDNIYFEAPGSTSAPLTGGSIDMFDSSASCTHLSTANSHLPAASTLSSPASPAANGLTPTAAAAAAATAGLQLQNARALSSGKDTSLHVQQTADSDSSSTVTAAGGQSQLGRAGSSGSLQGPQVCNPLLQPLPPVTMVFMAVEGSDQLVRRRRPFTAVVQTLLNRVVRDSLRRLGGYLCRVQEGDMKFMVAFASPVTALEWCLLVQTAAMYLLWPQSAIMLLPGCKEVVDSTGRLVFRGPRIKMGVCKGVPRSIIPDHEGRADYHGQSINMAARFMDKGARGGQIACTRELAEQVLAVWAAGGGSNSFTNPHSHLSVTESIAEYQPDSPDATTAADAAVEAAAGAAGLCPQAGCAAVVDGQSGSEVQPLDIEVLREQVAAGVGMQQVLSTNHSRPVRPVSKGPSPLSPGSAASAAAAPAPGEGSAAATAKPATAAAAAAAKAAEGVSGQDGMPARQRSTGGSWPGGLSNHHQQQQQQQGRQQAQTQCYPRLAAHLWLSHGRSSSDGSGHNGIHMQRSGSSRPPGTPQGTRALQPVLQSQPSGGLGTGLSAPPPPVAPSPFVMQDVVRVPFKVEVHRLGLYQFKGGPPQQEMVQVISSHLLGRLQFITADTLAPASRKGQLLQRLDGRVGQPVTVQLPVLAQEYHERLPNRVSGTTGLPHRCTSPAASGGLDGATPQLGSLAAGQAHGADVFDGRMWGSRSVSLPVRGGLGVSAGAAAAAGAADVAAAAGDGLGGVHSDPAFDRSAVLLAAAGAAEADASRPQSTSTVYSNLSLAANLNAAELGGWSGASGKPASQSSSQSSQWQQQQQGLLDGKYAPSNKQQQGLQQAGAITQKLATGKLSPESAAVAAAESCVLDMHGLVLRHDSFGSVGNVEPDQSSLPAALGDEELGLPAAAGGDGVGGPRSEAGTQVVRSARSSSSNRQGP